MIDLRNADQGTVPYLVPDVYLQLFVQSNDLRVEISLSLLRSSDKATIWSQVRHIPISEQGSIKDWSLANELSDQLFCKLSAQPELFLWHNGWVNIANMRVSITRRIPTPAGFWPIGFAHI